MDIDWKDLDDLWSIELGQDQGTLVVVFVKASKATDNIISRGFFADN